MKKLSLLLLFPFFILFACSSDKDNEPTTDPQRGDAMTIEQIVGTYVASEIIDDNSNYGFFNDPIELTFNEDYTGVERYSKTAHRELFTWSYDSDTRIISFSYSLHKNVKGWFENSNLRYRAYFINENGKQTENIATHTYVKK